MADTIGKFLGLADLPPDIQKMHQDHEKTGPYVQLGPGVFQGPGERAADPALYVKAAQRNVPGTVKAVFEQTAQHALTSVTAPPLNPITIIPPPGKDLLPHTIPPTRYEEDGLDSVSQDNASGLNMGRYSPITAFNPARQVLETVIPQLPLPPLPRVGPPIQSNPTYRTNFNDGVIPVRMPMDNEEGYTTFTPDQIDPSVLHVPLAITDLRPIGGNLYRTVYFRPLDMRVNESFSPDWSMAGFFGRVDPVATYQATGRSISLSFKLVAFQPEDLWDIYRKLKWLTSMVYPEYDGDLHYKSGPVVRMRVGNIIDAVGPDGNRGLPGVITSLDYDYSESTWEMENDFQAPREVAVSLSLTVLHDVPVGRYKDDFGGLGAKLIDGSYLTPKKIADLTDSLTGKEGGPDYELFRKIGDK